MTRPILFSFSAFVRLTGLTAWCLLAATANLPAQNLKMQFGFDDNNGTRTTDAASGRSLTFTNSAGQAADLRGSAGSGVSGLGTSLDLEDGTFAAGGAAYTIGNQNIVFGVVTNFTVSFWIKPMTGLLSDDRSLFYSLGFFSSLSSMATGYGQVNSISVGSGGDRIPGHSSVQMAINTSDSTWPFDAPSNQWTFLAVTYDSTNFCLYRGTTNSAVSLVAATNLDHLTVNIGAKFNLLAGNSYPRTNSFLGQMDDVRTYLGAASPSFLENVRQQGAFLMITSTVKSGVMNLAVSTGSGVQYVLQTSPSLTNPAWTPIATNIGTGAALSNNVPFQSGNQFFRYMVPATVEVTNRNELVIGTYKPNTNTTGVLPGTVLTAYNATNANSVSLNTAGTVIENKIIYGEIYIQAANVVIRNCRLVGGNTVASSASGVVNCNGLGCVNALIEDCDIMPQITLRNQDGIVGHEYTARRCHVQNTVDGFGVFPGSGQTNANVSLEGNFTHDLAYFYPDWKNGTNGTAWHADGTHNDGCQVQGGANIHIIGNQFKNTGIPGLGTGFSTFRPWILATGHANGHALLVQNNTKPLYNVVVEKNYLSHGVDDFNLQPGTCTFQNNICSTNVAQNYNPAYSPYPYGPYFIHIADRAACTIIGLTNPGNYFEETGAKMTEPQLSGIHYDQ